MKLNAKIHAMIGRGRRRLFFRRLVCKLPMAVSASLVLAAILYALSCAEVAYPAWLWAVVALPVVVLLVWAHPWRLSDIEIARQIDAANGLGERLSSSLAFEREAKPTEWMQAQIADTSRRLEGADAAAWLRNAFALRKPDHLAWLPIALVIAAVIVQVPWAVSKICEALQEPPAVVETPVAEPVVQAPNLDAVAQELRQSQAEQLLAVAEELDDPALKEVAAELAQILEEDREGKLSREEFERRLAELEKKIADAEAVAEAMNPQEQKSFDEAIREAVETMTQMKEDPDTKPLADALEKNDYDMAADILRDLLNSTDPNDRKKLEKMAKMLGDLAKKVDPTDPELKEALQRNKELVDQLKKELGGGALSEADKKAFADAERRLREAEGEQQQLEQQKAQQTADSQAGKALDKLSRAMDKTARDMDKKAQDGEGDGKDPKQNGEDAVVEKPQDGAQEKGKQPQDGTQKDGEKGQDGAQKDGQKRDGEKSAEDALRDAAAQKKAQENREALKDLAEKMRKDAQENQERQNDPNAQKRQENMQDFMDRAKGQEKKPQKQGDSGQEQPQDAQGQQQQGQQQQGDQGQQQQGQEGQQQQDSQGQQGDQGQQQQSDQGQEGQQGQQQGQQGQQQQDDQGDQGDQGQQLGQQGQQQPSDSAGPEPGKGHDTREGDATSMQVGMKDETLQGMDSSDMTTREVIEAAGQKGFASTAYREVYQTYEKAAEEVMESEEVPQGYRNYVEKYFDMIRPQ